LFCCPTLGKISRVYQITFFPSLSFIRYISLLITLMLIYDIVDKMI
jgi:hypothetical protein